MSFLDELNVAAKEGEKERKKQQKEKEKKISNPVFKKYFQLSQKMRNLSQINQETPDTKYTNELQKLNKQLQDIIQNSKEFEEFRVLQEEIKPLQKEFMEKRENIEASKKEKLQQVSVKMNKFMKDNMPELFNQGSQSSVKLSLMDKIKGVKGAFDRLRENGITNKDSYTSEKEAIERTVCCTTCTDGTSCPYCGCGIKQKKLLATENCPNKETYPHLKKFPPKNYWSVTKEKTSIIIAARNEIHLYQTVKNLLETATGDVEVLVGLDGYSSMVNNKDFVDVITTKKYGKADSRVKIHIEEEPIGRRSISNKLINMATGKFLFEADAHVIMKEAGWDTKLKCVCDDNMIVGCVIDSINEENWEPEGNKWLSYGIDNDFNCDWRKEVKDVSQWKKVEEVLSFHPSAWMITKKTFEDIGGHKEFLGKYVDEDAEFTCDVLCRDGKMVVRTDVECAHLFRDEFPYEVDDDIAVSRKLLSSLWKNESQNSYKTIMQVINDFNKKYQYA